MKEETKARRRRRIPSFWCEHGLRATLDASGSAAGQCSTGQSRRAGEAEMWLPSPRLSRAPEHRRKRQWPAKVVTEIRRLRKTCPNPGKETVHIRSNTQRCRNCADRLVFVGGCYGVWLNFHRKTNSARNSARKKGGSEPRPEGRGFGDRFGRGEKPLPKHVRPTGLKACR
jgi:hypothetical protein